MTPPNEELKGQEEQPKIKPIIGRPAHTTAKLHTMAETIMTMGSNLNELTSALDNLIKVTEKVTGRSLK